MPTTPPAPRFGVGFRSEHFDAITQAPRAVGWLEGVSDPLSGVGGPRRAKLDALRADHPILLHGVGLSIAASEPLSEPYLRGLRELADSIEPVFVSDHLCWTGFGGQQSHDLLPIAYTPEVLDHVAARVAQVQDSLGRPLLLENATAYVAFAGAQIDEGAFFAALCARTGCGMLLDVNNLYVNARNLGHDPAPILAAIPQQAVGYLHLAGHAALADVCIDTHGAAISDPVWELYEVASRRFPNAGVIIERDDDLPAFAVLAAEAEQARQRHRTAGAADGVSRREPVATPALEPGPSWRALQRSFFARLVDKPAGFDHASDAELTSLLDDAHPVSAARGMRVYSDAYTTGLRRALGVNFPALARVLAARDFAALTSAYLQRHPPRAPDFVTLGAAFARFIRTHAFADDYGVSPAVLAEIAALEQAQIEVANETGDAPALGADALSAIEPAQWDAARFGFAPALRVVPATHDVLPVLAAVARDEDPERPLPWRGAHLVHRGNGALATERIDAGEAAVLASLIAGRDFGTACDAAPGDDGAERVACGVRALLAACARGLVLRVDIAQR
jgi:uncharacterized protein (UPF0276 family)